MKKSFVHAKMFLWVASLSGCNPQPAGTGATTGASAGTASETSTTTTTATTAVTTSEASSATTAACTVVPDKPGECSVECQDCPPTEKCVVFAEEGEESIQTACRPIPEDPKAPGESCTVLGDSMNGDNDCEPGSTCIGFPYFPDLRCVEFCKDASGSLSCPDTSTRCTVFASAPLCLPVCDPRIPDSCDYGCRSLDPICPDCFPMTEGGTFTCRYPFAEEEGSEGVLCSFNDCREDLFCGPPGRVPGCDANTPCCTQYCYLEQPACPEGTACEAVFASGTAPLGLEDLGACLIPE